MKSWCDLSYSEKCRIREGRVNPFKYLSGYDFSVKTKVQENQNKKNVSGVNNATDNN